MFEYLVLELINTAKGKDKGNQTLWCVWIFDETRLVLRSLISPSESFRSRSYVKDSIRVFHRISIFDMLGPTMPTLGHNKVKIFTRRQNCGASYFSSLLGILYVMKHCISCLIYYIANTASFKVVLLNTLYWEVW